MSSASWFERNKKLSLGVGVAAVVGAVAVGAYLYTKKPRGKKAKHGHGNSIAHHGDGRIVWQRTHAMRMRCRSS